MLVLSISIYFKAFLQLSKVWAWKLWVLGRGVASLIVNYSIYGFRRMILLQNDQQARKMNNEQYRQFLDEKIRRIEIEKLKMSADVFSKNPQAVFSQAPLTDDNLHVHSLWIGSTLSKIELLTIHSFIQQGHIFHLWAYENIQTELPAGVIIEDANQILPSEAVFRYRSANKYGHGKGSVSGFSDIFRYKLLYMKGGWWTDMDVTCLKPLNATTRYFFRKHHQLQMVGNVMKVPPQSKLMLDCYEQAAAEVNENNTDWHKPIDILIHHVFANGLDLYIFAHVSNVDDWDQLVPHIVGDEPIPEHYWFVHWMNEEWRSRQISKNDFRFGSALGLQMQRYGLIQAPESLLAFKWNTFKHRILLKPYYNFR